MTLLFTALFVLVQYVRRDTAALTFSKLLRIYQSIAIDTFSRIGRPEHLVEVFSLVLLHACRASSGLLPSTGAALLPFPRE